MLVLRNGTETSLFGNNLLTFPQCVRCTLRIDRKAGAISEDRRAEKYFWQGLDKADKLIKNFVCLLCLRAFLWVLACRSL